MELRHRRNRSSVHLVKLMPWSAHALGPINAILNISILDLRSTSTHGIDSNITFLALPSLFIDPFFPSSHHQCCVPTVYIELLYQKDPVFPRVWLSCRTQIPRYSFDTSVGTADHCDYSSTCSRSYTQYTGTSHIPTAETIPGPI